MSNQISAESIAALHRARDQVHPGAIATLDQMLTGAREELRGHIAFTRELVAACGPEMAVTLLIGSLGKSTATTDQARENLIAMLCVALLELALSTELAP